LWCKKHLDKFIAKAASHATTMGHIKRGDMDSAMALIPSKEELKDMNSKMLAYFEKIKTNQSQIRTLTQLRETLLPMLMSEEFELMK
jgi:type I restriction enzyme S subunit